jgi:cysteine synthase A
MTSVLNPPAPCRGRIYDSVLATIGATPLVRLPRIAAEQHLVADLVLKLEFFNPLGSVKDRIGLAMVDAAEAEGLIRPGHSVLVEPTSGNTGIALAFVAAARGYRLIVCMPAGASVERQKMIRLLGAEVQLTPAATGMTGAIARAEAVVAATPGAWMPRQFDNPANPAIHAATTAEEIWTDTAGAVDIVVGGVGTGGTLTGIARALLPRRPGLRVFVVEPIESAVLSGDEPGPHGVQGIGAGFHPAVLDMTLMAGIIRVSEREAIAAARQSARMEGLPIGISSGAALHAGMALARQPENAGQLIVAIAPSFAERYLSTALFAGL